MNIYFLGQKGIPAKGGGIERHAEELTAQVAKQGHTVFAYARKRYTKTDVQLHRGVHIIYTPTIYTKHLEAITHTFTSILNLVTRKNVDIVHVHGIGPSLLIPMVRLLKPRAKVVSTIHCADYHHQKWGWFARTALKTGEYIAAKFSHQPITVSKGLREQILADHSVKAVYIPNGVNLNAESVSEKALEQWGLKKDQYVVAISRLIRHKGLHFLIEAYKRMTTDKKLVIVGGSEYTDDYVQELYDLAGDHPGIIFTGKQSGESLQALFEHAYLFVQPSLSEGLSIALLEALSYRQAILASDIPENKEVIAEIGLLFKAGETDDLTAKLRFALAHPEVMKQKKELGRKHVEVFYNWKDIAENTIQLYRTLSEPLPIKTPKKIIALAKSVS